MNELIARGADGMTTGEEPSTRDAIAALIPPLTGIRVVEFEGLGPGPLAGVMLADMGATVTVVARPATNPAGRLATTLGGEGENPLRRGKRLVHLDLKQPADRDEAIRLIAGADALIEGNRPGVMERLGLGPADCAIHNPRLIYGRMTGWGQTGPLAGAAGHDLNYVALTGLLSLSARPGQAPMVPPTVLGDAGGALGLAFGIACALIEVRTSGRGRVVDAAIVDIVAMLGQLVLWIRGNGQIDGPDPSPFHGSPFYDVYRCADGGFVALGALEPQFYASLLEKLGMNDVDPATQFDPRTWPALKRRFADLLATRSRDAWCALLEGTDVCFAPVLRIAEAAAHPHNVARGMYRIDDDGKLRAMAAPRYAPLDE